VHLFILLLEFKKLSEKFLILRRIKRDIIMNVQSEYKVFVILTRILMNFEFSRHIFKNTQISNFTKIRPVVAQSFHADGRTDGRTEGRTEGRTDGGADRRKDMMKLMVAFRNFAYSPN
jgi:hypothetical protein